MTSTLHSNSMSAWEWDSYWNLEDAKHPSIWLDHLIWPSHKLHLTQTSPDLHLTWLDLIQTRPSPNLTFTWFKLHLIVTHLNLHPNFTWPDRRPTLPTLTQPLPNPIIKQCKGCLTWTSSNLTFTLSDPDLSQPDPTQTDPTWADLTPTWVDSDLSWFQPELTQK